MNLRDQYIKDGYIILRKFFEKEKLVSLKEEFLKIGNNFEKEILEYEFVKNLYLNDKFVNVIKILLNTDKLMYFLHQMDIITTQDQKIIIFLMNILCLELQLIYKKVSIFQVELKLNQDHKIIFVLLCVILNKDQKSL